MSVSRFRPAFILMLLIPLFIQKAAADDRVGMKRVAAHQAQANAQELDEPPMGESGNVERFMSKLAQEDSPIETKTLESKVVEEVEAARSNSNSLATRRVSLNSPAPALFNGEARRLTLIDKTYLDAYVILRENNSCSQFFGGPHVATSILNFLHPRLKETSLGDAHVAISMFGSFTLGTDSQTGVSYRLFQQALVNLRGPFYQSVNYRSQDFFHKIGQYPANTREARVTMLLHELGHLLLGADGRWLLPDDGGNRLQIAANTAIIMKRCSQQIESLKAQGSTKPD